jgi:hypothetical protein
MDVNGAAPLLLRDCVIAARRNEPRDILTSRPIISLPGNAQVDDEVHSQVGLPHSSQLQTFYFCFR